MEQEKNVGDALYLAMMEVKEDIAPSTSWPGVNLELLIRSAPETVVPRLAHATSEKAPEGSIFKDPNNVIRVTNALALGKIMHGEIPSVPYFDIDNRGSYLI
jgi:hypothetical protein